MSPADGAPGPLLAPILAMLAEAYGEQTLEDLHSWFECVLWENVAYLVDDDRRRAAWQRLKGEVGTETAALLAIEPARLTATVRDGGILPEHRAEKLQKCAAIVVDELDGDIKAFLSLDLGRQQKLLAKFPSIGRPGAAKVLLFSGIEAIPGLESSGLRVLTRLGLAKEGSSYDQTYRSGIAALASLGRSLATLRQAYLLLRRHGQTICRRSLPRCDLCPLLPHCPRVGL